uniref:alpha hemolysin fused with spy-catcher n=1 Tax=Staphylococcus aureus TaxID=1280 RepID=UPI00336AECEF
MADSDINIKTGTTDIGSNTTVKTGDLVTYDKENGMHKKVFYSFIDDKNHNKKLLVIRTKGTIAGQYRVYSEEGANKSGLAWPSAFKVQLQLPDNEVAQISDYYPRNSIDTKEYMSTLTYGFNSNVTGDDTGKIGGLIGANVSIGHTLRYVQPDFKTILESPTDKKVGWKVIFNNMVNQNWGPYDRDSWNPVYGNQLFMKTRNGSMKAADNFLDPNKASSLLSSGFSPDFATVITMDRCASKQQTNIDVIYERVRDDYQLHWTSTNWKGTNTKDKWTDRSSERYKIDWEKEEMTNGSSGSVTTLSGLSGEQGPSGDMTTEEDSATHIKFSKRDEDGRELAGATMELRDSSGKTISTWISDGHVKDFYLYPGKYTFVETAAPDGYEVATPIEFTVNEDGQVTVDGEATEGDAHTGGSHHHHHH